jgi:phenol 2-monooxygenase
MLTIDVNSERGMQRFYVLLDGQITQEKTEASIRRHMAPHTVEFTHVEWFSKFESELIPL